jgi:hypothetical protein
MMKRSGLLFVGLSALALANTALATEPTVLTDVQLDNVAAGYASVWSTTNAWTGGHYAVSGSGSTSFYLDDGSTPYATISSSLSTTSYGSGTTNLYLSTGATAY